MKKKLLASGTVLLVLGIVALSVWKWQRPGAENAPIRAEPTAVEPLKKEVAAEENKVDLTDLAGLDQTLPPLVEAIADLKAREPVQHAKELAAILERHGIPLPRRLRELNEQQFQPLLSNEAWEEFARRTEQPWDLAESVLRDQTKIKQKAFDLYMDLLICAAQKSSSVSVRIRAAYLLAGHGVPGVKGDAPLPPMHPTSEQIATSFERAFHSIVAPDERVSVKDLEFARLWLFHNTGGGPPMFCYFWALADGWTDKAQQLDKVVEDLQQKENRLLAQLHASVLKDQSAQRKKALASIEELLLLTSSVDLLRFAGRKAMARRQIEPILRSFILAINSNDRDGASKLILDKEFESFPKEAKLLDGFSSRQDVVSLTFRGMGDVYPFDGKNFQVRLFLFQITAEKGRIATDFPLRLILSEKKWQISFKTNGKLFER